MLYNVSEGSRMFQKVPESFQQLIYIEKFKVKVSFKVVKILHSISVFFVNTTTATTNNNKYN